MEAKREKTLLKAVLRKLFVGLIFCFTVLGGSMITGTATVKADIYKTLSFNIYSGEPLDISFPGYDDKKDGAPEVANWNSYGNRGTIISTGGRTPIETGPDAGRYKYTITMNKVNVTGKTPWLKIKVKNNSDCIAQSFGFSDTKQSAGLSSSNGSPHYTGDKYKNDGDSLLVYMGLAFAETRIDARIGYDLTIAYNGATTKPTGGASSIKSDGTAATWKGYFHRYHYRADMPYYNDSGAIPGIFGSGDIKKKGYMFDGWYCGTNSAGKPVYLFDSAGNPIKNVSFSFNDRTGKNKRWSSTDTPPKYLWTGGTTVTAHWTSLDLHLDYNGATTIPSKETDYLHYFTYNETVPNIYGSSKIAKTGYTFDGWYCGNVKLWNSDGSPVKGAKVNGSYWSDSNGNYVWKGDTTVKAHWTPKKYDLKLFYEGADEGFRPVGGATSYEPDHSSAEWKNYFTYGEKVPNIFGSGDVKRAGYTFDGWYCGNVKLWNSDGSPVKGAKVNGSYWSDSNGKYVWTSSQATTVHAHWTQNHYNLTIYYNNSDTRPTGLASEIADDKSWARWDGFFTYDKSISNVFDSENMKRTGYTFDGWYCGDVKLWNSNGSPVKGAKVNGSYWSDSNGNYVWAGNTTVKAHWTPICYKIVYDGNKPSGVSDDVKDIGQEISVIYDTTVKLEEKKPSLKNYSFTGWNTKPDGTGTSYSAGQEISNLTVENKKVITLYAQWVKNTSSISYNIAYNSNKPSNATNTVAEDITSVTNIKVGVEVQIQSKPSLKGWKFDYWTEKADGSGKKYYNGDKVQNLTNVNNATVTLYAHWTPEKYTVTYNPNGGSGSTVTDEAVYDTAYAVKDNASTGFTKTGSKFAGWKDQDGNSYSEGSSFKWTYSKNITLYAQWTEKEYTVNFNYNKPNTEQTIENNGTKNKKVAYKAKYGTLPSPTLNGYKFNGWYTAKDGGNSVSSSTVYSLTTDQTLYAHWTLNTYDISYTLNGGGLNNAPKSYNVNTSALTIPRPTRTGYTFTGWTFTGWNTKADGSGDSYTNSQTVTNLTSTNGATITLYAQWEANKYRINLEKMAGENGTDFFYEKYDTGFYSDENCKNKIKDKKIKVPSRVNYKFNGYFTEKSSAGTAVIDTDGNIKCSANFFPDKININDGKPHYEDTTSTVYASWIPATYKITLDDNGGKGGSGAIYEWFNTGYYADKNHNQGISSVKIPERTGYKFCGYWTRKNNSLNTDEPMLESTYKWLVDGSIKISDNGSLSSLSSTDFSKNTTLYALWVPKEFTITLSSEDADISHGTPQYTEVYGYYNYANVPKVSTNGATKEDTPSSKFTGSWETFTAPYTGEYTFTDGSGNSKKVTLKQGEIIKIYNSTN